MMGLRVATTYQKRRVYLVSKILWDQNPNNHFFKYELINSGEIKEQSIAEYYQQRYGITLDSD